MTQLSLFPDMIEPWQEQRLEWWDMHGFRPKKGVIAMITDMCAKGYPNGTPFYALWVECEIIEVENHRLIVRPIHDEDSNYKLIRNMPELWEVDYYGVDAILYK